MNKKIITPLIVAALLLSVSGAYAATTMLTPENSFQKTANTDVPDVPEHVTVSDSMVNAAQERATVQVRAASQRASPNARGLNSSTSLLQQAEVSLEASNAADEEWGALVAARKASVNARAAHALEQANDGELTAADVRDDAAEARAELERAKRTLPRDCDTEACVVVVAEAERSLAAAESYLDQVPQLVENSRTESRGIAYAASAVEAARLNVEDARNTVNANQDLVHGTAGESESIDLDARYAALHDVADAKIDGASYPIGSYAESVVQQAQGHVDVAEQRYADGYKASATVNLMKAILLANAAGSVQELPAPVDVDENTITPEQVQAAKAGATTSLDAEIEANAGDALALDLLETSENRITAADDLVIRASQLSYEDSESLIMGYGNYLIAQSINEDAAAVSDIGQ